MTTQTDAMRIALDALITAKSFARGFQYQLEIKKAITAIIEALAQPAVPQGHEQEPVARAWDEGYRQGVKDERISEANIGIAGFGAKVEPARQNPYGTTKPAQPQEPVVIVVGDAHNINVRLLPDGMELKPDTKLYTTPPQRKLTDEPTKEMIDAAERIDWSDSDVRGNIVNMWQAMAAVAPQRNPMTDEVAIFAAQHMFLEWNRRQDERLVKVAYEYGVFQKAIELYNEAAHGKGDA